MREIKTKALPTERPLIEVKLDDFTLQARRPKDSVIMRAQAVVTDKYAPDGAVARAALDFLEAALERDSWVHLVGRLNDREDAFDTEELGELYEALFEEMTDQAKAEAVDAAPNREARRRVQRG